MNIDLLIQIAWDNLIIGNLICFFIMLIGNITPIMFFLNPDIGIFFWIFLAKKVTVWYIPYISIILWSLTWESISYLIWYKYWYKILKGKFFQKKTIKTTLKKIESNWIKTLILGKIFPWIVWFIPILSGITKLSPKKFFITNFIMIIYGISIMFIIWFLWINLIEKYIWKQIWIILLILLINYIIFHTIYIIKKNSKSNS